MLSNLRYRLSIRTLALHDTVQNRHPSVVWRQKAASHQGTQPPEVLLTRYRSSVRRYQNPQSRIRKANPHAESVDHPVDRSAIPNLVVLICDRRHAKVGLASVPNYSMSLGFIVTRLICEGLNLQKYGVFIQIDLVFRIWPVILGF